jgi:N-formylglutamate deformylase
MSPSWLTVTRGDVPLVVSLPHTGTTIPADIESRLASPWLARKDADWHVDHLYGFAAELGATVVRTAISRTVIDVNRDPSGVSLYPGQPTTALCPTETFDGEPLYRAGEEPAADEIAERRRTWFDPYHEAIDRELARLSAGNPRVVLYDGHSIRSVVPRLFDGELPHFNIGTNDGRSCAAGLTRTVERVCDTPGWTRVTNGRFKGGYITRHHGRPDAGIHAIQMELACRGYLPEPPHVDETNWPPPSDQVAPEMSRLLELVLRGALAWARSDPAAEAAAGAP